MQLISNVINKDYLSDLYISILEDLGDILVKSYGPYGSNTLIQKGPDSFPIYTKDGHTILSNVKYHNIIERTITSNILSITEYIVKNVGDGTTSAVLLSRNILKGLLRLQEIYKKNNHHVAPIVIIRTFKEIIDEMIDVIRKNGREFSVENKDPYNISMISTNGDKDISERIQTLYDNLGKEVYISLVTTSQKDDIVSIYDGLVLETGLIEECYINEPERKVCVLNSPRIYAFADPIDTPEMIMYFETIVKRNIYDPLTWVPKNGETEENRPELKPTLIIAPKISRDASSLMEYITSTMSKMTGGMVRNRPPLLVITNLESVDQDQYSDIMNMCACPPIRKYINPEIQKQDQKKGVAPNINNIQDFFGTCGSVEADSFKTSFFNPYKMMEEVVDEDGTVEYKHSAEYDSLISFIENELVIAKENKADYTEIYHLKKRLNSLKSVFVEWHVGGVSPADRDQRMSTIDDAVKNCRSAARDGVGMGANIEGFRANYLLLDQQNGRYKDDIMLVINEAYFDMLVELYKYKVDKDQLFDKLVDMIKNNEALNLVDSDIKVLSSIESDIMILEGIANLITIMATSNQYICPQPIDTTPYRAEEAINKKKEAMNEKEKPYMSWDEPTKIKRMKS